MREPLEAVKAIEDEEQAQDVHRLIMRSMNDSRIPVVGPNSIEEHDRARRLIEIAYPRIKQTRIREEHAMAREEEKPDPKVKSPERRNREKELQLQDLRLQRALWLLAVFAVIIAVIALSL
jgi:hypothetical protein